MFFVFFSKRVLISMLLSQSSILNRCWVSTENTELPFPTIFAFLSLFHTLLFYVMSTTKINGC